MLRDVMEAWNIRIFDRVTSIELRQRDWENPPVDRNDISNFEALQQVTFKKHSASAFEEAELKAVKKVVPPWRLAGVNASQAGVDIRLAPGAAIGCVSNE